jgi:pimeloyl-ACP methyl ester carboxylesterase
MSPIIVALIVIFSAWSISAQTSSAWRYDLHSGDHLTYRYTFQRHTESKEEELKTEARYRTHVLVVGESPEHITLGFQRNREVAELTEYHSKGKDRLAKEQIDFQKRMQLRPTHFSEAMEISPTGEPHYPWEFARETYSHLIATFLHEVPTLPAVSPMKGAAWQTNALPGLDFRWIEDESIHGKLCHHVEGAFPNGSLKLNYWWSPESGVLEQITLEGIYSDSGTMKETARMELESRTRGESLESWLAAPDTRLGALQALMLNPSPLISAEQLSAVFSFEDPSAQSLALAVAFRRKIDLPAAVLNNLRQSKNVTIQTLLAQHAKNPPPLVDECHRALPVKAPPTKFGTIMEATSAVGEANNHPISYLLRIPVSYREDRPSPLLIVLSGGAGFAIDGMISSEAVVSQTDYLVLYPQAAAYWWTPETAARFNSVFNDVVQRYNVDRDRIYLTGFSNGGTGSLYFAELWPQRFAAVVPLMGAGQCNEQVKAGLPNLKNLPLLFVHGENDPIITPDCSKTTHAALTDLNPAIKPQLKILPNHAHDITLESDEGLALAFFKDKVRNAFPRVVDLSESDSLADRAYWIEILNGKAGKSDIDARVKPDNTIEIHSHEVKSIRLHLRSELLPKRGDFRIVWNGKKIFSGPIRDYCSLSNSAPAEDPKLDLSDTRDLALP